MYFFLPFDGGVYQSDNKSSFKTVAELCQNDKQQETLENIRKIRNIYKRTGS